MDENAEKRLEDYSLVFVKRVEQLKLPVLVSFSFVDFDIYVGPKSTSNVHKKSPGAVVDFFMSNPKQHSFEHEGWLWRRTGYYDTGFYTREQDRKVMIFDKIVPYMDKLKSFEKKTVAVNELLPPFERNKYHNNAFDISQTGFQLVLEEVSGLVKVVVAEIDRGFFKLQSLAVLAGFEYEAK